MTPIMNFKKSQFIDIDTLTVLEPCLSRLGSVRLSYHSRGCSGFRIRLLRSTTTARS